MVVTVRGNIVEVVCLVADRSRCSIAERIKRRQGYPRNHFNLQIKSATVSQAECRVHTAAKCFHHFLEEPRLLVLLLRRPSLVVLQRSSSRTRSRLLAHQVGITVLELCLCARRRCIHVHLAGQSATSLRQIAPCGAACAVSGVLSHGCHSWLRWRTWGRGLCRV